MQQIGGVVGLAALVTISTAVEDDRLPGATRALTRARTAGDDSVVVRALDAEVHGYAAAYTASLILLVAATAVTLLVVTAPLATPRGRRGRRLPPTSVEAHQADLR
jgi:hypothetical protein